MAGVVRPSIEGGRRLRDTAQALREAGRDDLKRELRKVIRDEGQPTLDAIKRSAREIKVVGLPTPSRHRFRGVSTPKRLRARIADASVLEYRNNDAEARVSFRVDSSRMGDAAKLPKKIDSGKPWRHPIYGKRGRWAASQGQPWFFAPIKDQLPDYRRRINEAIDVIIEKVEKS